MIGVFDSGSGGLSVLKEIVKLLPEEKYVYYADNAHCPYGEKTPEYILERSREISSLLISKGCDIIVVACNTATAAAIAQLRQEFSIKFIGMEPAVKPAVLGTKSGVIGVLATSGTLKGSKYLTTKEQFEEDAVKIKERVGKGFVELVESGEITGPKAEEIVTESLRPLLDAGADTIVLGCTHYPFLLDILTKVSGPGVSFIDPAPSVARHLIYIMVQEHLLNETKATKALSRVIENAEAEALGCRNAGLPKNPDVELLSSGDPASLNRIYSLIFSC